MRPITKYLLLLLLIGSSAVSCIKVEEQETYEEIVWNVVCHKASSKPDTKAAQAMENNANFATCVWRLDNDSHSWATNKNIATFVELGPVTGFRSGSKATGIVSYDPAIEKWKISGYKLMWPEIGSLNVYSFTAGRTNASPICYKINDPAILTNTQKGKIEPTKEGLNIVAWDTTTDDQYVDLLVSEMQVDKRSPSSYQGMNGLVTEFSHIMTKVNFQFFKSEQPISYVDHIPANTTIRLREVKFKNYWYKANYINGGTASQRWVYSSPASDSYVKRNPENIFSGTENLSITTPLERGHLYIPQNLYDVNKNFGAYDLTEATLVISYDIIYDGNTTPKNNVEIPLPSRMGSNVWNPGMIYTYVIKIGGQQVPIEFEASTGEWGTGDGLINGGEAEI